VNPVLRSLALLALGFALLVLQSALTVVVPIYPFTPNLLLPVVIFLGVSHEVPVVRGALTSFVLGYLLDLFCGNLMSLQTFLCVATFMLSRGAGLRLFMRNPGFQVLLAFFVALMAGAATLALRGVFGTSVPFPAGGGWSTALSLLAPATATGVAAPLVFALVRRIDQVAGPRREADGAQA